jgi:ribosome recycling factor
MIKETLKDTTDKMHRTVESVSHHLGTVRAGKASTHMLDSVRVEAYGSFMPLNQLATVSAPEPRLLTIQPFDKGTIGDIAKGITKAELGLNPNVDGNLIRIVIPALNEERRKELVKQCKHYAEEGRVAVRNVRREANEHLKKLLKDKKISEDEEKNALIDVQELTDKHIKEIDVLLGKKEAEILEV